MANKDLNCKPHHINENAWWYEERAGISVVVRREAIKEIDNTVVIDICWRDLRAALRRKDKKG